MSSVVQDVKTTSSASSISMTGFSYSVFISHDLLHTIILNHYAFCKPYIFHPESVFSIYKHPWFLDVKNHSITRKKLCKETIEWFAADEFSKGSNGHITEMFIIFKLFPYPHPLKHLILP